MLHNGHLISTTGYCADVFSDAALRFITDAIQQDTPFFACLAFNTPHTPLHIGEEWVGRFRKADLPETFARIYGMVENIDWNAGRILTALESAGHLDDTLVIFTSDHGPCPSANDRNRIRWNAGLRGQKGGLYEGGIRVPFFWRWPEHIPADTVCDRLVTPQDLLPTLAELAGGGFQGDGRSLCPLLRGESNEWPDRWIPMQWHRGDLPQWIW